MFMQLSMWEDKMTDLERFVAIDPCLFEPMQVKPNELSYLEYLQNEATLHAFAGVH